jgi:hypothetical protein
MPGGTVPPDPWRFILELFDSIDQPMQKGDVVSARAALEEHRPTVEAVRDKVEAEPG